jgi:hypothetical protein
MSNEVTHDRWRNHYLNFFRGAVKNPPPGYVCNKSAEEIESEAQRLLNDFRQGNEKKSRSTFVNCWCENEHESDAMWRLFSEHSQYAIAIRTTVGRLRKSVDAHVTLGRVRYIDYDKEYPDISFPHFFKRVAFEHEREVRAVVLDTDAAADSVGKTIEVDLRQLVTAVRVSPTSAYWFRDVVRDLTTQFDLGVDVSTSVLARKAFR